MTTTERGTRITKTTSVLRDTMMPTGCTGQRLTEFPALQVDTEYRGGDPGGFRAIYAARTTTIKPTKTIKTTQTITSVT
jgi:hypothetical protein